MLTPFDHLGSELFKFITLICDNLNEMLEDMKNRFDNKKNNPNNTANSPTKIEEPRVSMVKFEDEKREAPKTNHYLLDTYLTKDFWFFETDIDMPTIANVVSYCVKSLTIEGKWRVVVETTKHFCNVTVQFYSTYVLPFTKYVQKMLLNQAREKTNAKRTQLNDRIKVFEDWKKTIRRKNRADAMTGNIPPEQQEFEKDEAELNNQIAIHRRIEDFFNADKKRTSELLKILKRDENKVLEALNDWRKLLAKYGNDRKAFNMEKRMNLDPADLKVKERDSAMLSHTVTSKYKDCIESLKKKQENFALIQALHERGNIYFSIGDVKNYMQDWNESLDTIFQRIFSLKNWREIFQEHKNLAWDIGVEKCLIGSILLYKLANFGYFTDIHSQMECSLMAYELVFAIFKITMPHQFIPISFGPYRIKEILQDRDLFSNKYVLSPADLIVACNYHALYLMDNGHHIKAIPLIGLMEYLSADIAM